MNHQEQFTPPFQVKADSLMLLKKASVTADGVPTFTMNTVQTGGQIILTTTAFRDVTATTPTWSMQIGLRYIFN